MKKKVTIAALVVLLAALIIALFSCGSNGSEEKPATEPLETTEQMHAGTTEGTTAETTEAAATEATEEMATEATEAATSPALEDSIFDDDKDSTGNTEDKKNQNQNGGSAKPPKDPKPTEPKPTTPKPTEPTKPTEGDPSDDYVTEYERFLEMSPSEQEEYVDSFPSLDAFFDWYNAAKEAYEQANPPIDAGDGNIDIGDIIEGKG